MCFFKSFVHKLAILDDRKSPLIAFLGHFRSICKMAVSGHFGSRFFAKIDSRSVAMSNMKLIGVFVIKLLGAQLFHQIFFEIFYKMADDGHFG